MTKTFNMFDKKNNVQIESLKLALEYGLILEKNHGIIEFNQEAWSNPYIDMNTELTKKAQKLF